MNSTVAVYLDSALPWLTKDLNVESMVRMLVALVALFSLPFLRVMRASFVLSRDKMTVKHTRGRPGYLLPRLDVIKSLQRALEHPE